MTSIKARGFCGRADDVQLRLLFGSGIPDESYDSVDILLIEAECNKTTSSSMMHEGQVVNDNLHLYIPPNGFLSVFFNPDCTKGKCFFQPAIINETSNHTLLISDAHLQFSAANMSLLLSANITGVSTALCIIVIFNYYCCFTIAHIKSNNKWSSNLIVGVTVCSILLCVSFIFIILVVFIRRQQLKKTQGDLGQLPNVQNKL